MTDTELAWAAGFFDGEGCTYIMKQKQHKYVAVTVSQKDRRSLDRFAQAVGYGNVRGENSRLHHWHLCGTKARKVLDLLWPYLSAPKREQAEGVIESVELSKCAS